MATTSRIVPEIAIDYTKPLMLLLHSVGWHSDDEPVDHKYHCFYGLMHLGACSGHTVFLLQIVARTWNFEEDRLLLEAGEDRNNTGDLECEVWGQRKQYFYIIMGLGAYISGYESVSISFGLGIIGQFAVLGHQLRRGIPLLRIFSRLV